MTVSTVVDNTTTLDNRTLSWNLGTVAAGDVIVVQMTAEDNTASMNAPAVTAGTAVIVFTQRKNTTTASKAWCTTYTGTVTLGGTATVTSSPNGWSTNRNHGGVAYVFPTADGYSLAATPVSFETISTGAPASASQTYTSTGNAVCVVNGDFAAKTGTITYRTGLGAPTQVSVAQAINNGQYFFYQPAISAATGIVGMTAPTAQAYTIQGVEVLKGAAAAAPPKPPAVIGPMGTF